MCFLDKSISFLEEKRAYLLSDELEPSSPSLLIPMSSLTRALKTMFPMVAPFSRCLSQRAKNIFGIKSTYFYGLGRSNDPLLLLGRLAF